MNEEWLEGLSIEELRARLRMCRKAALDIEGLGDLTCRFVIAGQTSPHALLSSRDMARVKRAAMDWKTGKRNNES